MTQATARGYLGIMRPRPRLLLPLASFLFAYLFASAAAALWPSPGSWVLIVAAAVGAWAPFLYVEREYVTYLGRRTTGARTDC